MGFIADEVIEAAKCYIRTHLKPSRREHTENVVKTARELAERFGGDVAKATAASWFHDIARNFTVEELDRRIEEYGLDSRLMGNSNLSHSKVAVEIMKREFGIEDEDVLSAVSYHTTGRAGMSTVEKIVFLADAIEPGRDYPGVEKIREATERGLDQGCLCSLKNTIEHLKEDGRYIAPDTMEAWEELRSKVGAK